MSLLTGCSADERSTSCERGRESVEDVSREFLRAARDSDLEAFQYEVLPRLEVTESDLSRVNSILDGRDVDDLFISSTSEGALTRYQVSVIAEDGELVSTLEIGEMIDDAPGCFGVNYGDQIVDPAASPTPGAALEN
jgi:hypothetical protein